jgi:hypothetical protein
MGGKLKRFGYIRVPKTGSGSIENYIEFYKIKHRFCGIHHIPYTLLSNHKHDHEYFCFVRNPLQLYCSFYYFMKRVNSSPDNFNNPLFFTPFYKKNIKLICEDNLDINDFLLNCDKNQMLSYFIDPLPLEDISFIGIFENMENSLKIMNEKFNMNIDNKKININHNKDFKELYQVDSKIEKIFKNRNEREYEIYSKSLEIYKSYNK